MNHKVVFELPQLQHYMAACWVENFLTIEELGVLNNFWQQSQKEAARVDGEGGIAPSLRQSAVTPLHPGLAETQWFFNKISQLAGQINSERYRFELLGFYEPVQIAEYSEGDFFDWHMDFGNNASSNRKLSISVQLSDTNEYEGGDLQFMVNTDVVNAPRSAGTAVIFPSFVQHRVSPITKGKRRSIVGWVSGNPYK